MGEGDEGTNIIGRGNTPSCDEKSDGGVDESKDIKDW